MKQTHVRSGPAAASSIPLVVAEAVVAAAAAVVVSARDLRSSARSLEQRVIKPSGAASSSPPRRAGRRPPLLARSPPRRVLPVGPSLRAPICVRGEGDAKMRPASYGRQNGCFFWVICWRVILGRQITVDEAFWVWVTLWVSCWRQP